MELDMLKKPDTKTKSRVDAGLAPATASAAKSVVKASPTRDEIARRAHEIYVARGKGPGREVEDWVQAERELLGRHHSNN